MSSFYQPIRSIVRRIPIKGPANGFTLLELMVVIGCLTILLTAVAPRVRQYIHSASLSNAVYQLSGDLYAVKSQAVRTRTTCSINFDDVAQTYTLALPNPVRTVNLSDFHGNVVFTANPDGSTDVFSPTIAFNYRGLSGLAPAVPTQVYVRNQDNRIFRIQVSAAGAISMETWSAASSKWVQ